MSHEMVILPLGASQVVGTRPFGGDAKIDEAGSLGEASNSDGEGAGKGIAPDASSWITVTLAPGQYALVCNLMGHYVSVMYSKLTVTEGHRRCRKRGRAPGKGPPVPRAQPSQGMSSLGPGATT